MTTDEKYMSRCIQLAANGRCNTAPNPMVGAVIVHNGRIIGEGYHIRCGEAHAEVNAINSVKDKELLKNSTIYVSLEPCSHYGKTPPCADLIIKVGIPRIVVGTVDPFPLVAGRGIKKLRDAGREVIVGVLEKEVIELMKRFITFNTLKRPYITLKWAESADGFIDTIRKDGKPIVLSTPLTSMLVHKYRAESQSILVGKKTALLDNPSLTTRNWYGKNPLRLVIDRNLELPHTLNLFDSNVRTIIFNEIKDEIVNKNLEYKKISFSKDVTLEIMNTLYSEKIESIIIEGGAFTLEYFIKKGLWDDVFIEKSIVKINDGVKAPKIEHFASKNSSLRFGKEIIHMKNYNKN